MIGYIHLLTHPGLTEHGAMRDAVSCSVAIERSGSLGTQVDAMPSG